MRRGIVAVLAAVIALAGCTEKVTPPADAGAPTGPRCVEQPSPSASGGTTSAPALPAMALPCFSGGRFTNVADLGDRPTLVNLWASYCGPCRDELPVLAREAGKVRVVGVVTADGHTAAQSVIDDLHLTFPMLEDRDRQFALAAGPLVSKSLVSLPATLFIAPGGRIAYAYQGPALTDARLKELTQQYLGVAL